MNSKTYESFYVFMRNTYINLFKKNILLLEKDNIILDNKYMLSLIDKLYMINLKYLLENEKINVVYKLDDLIFYDNYDKTDNLKVSSVILDVVLIVNNELYINVLDNIKMYSLQVPIFIIRHLEKYGFNDKIKITVLKSFSKKILEYNVIDILDKKLYEIL